MGTRLTFTVQAQRRQLLAISCIRLLRQESMKWAGMTERLTTLTTKKWTECQKKLINYTMAQWELSRKQCLRRHSWLKHTVEMTKQCFPTTLRHCTWKTHNHSTSCGRWMLIRLSITTKSMLHFPFCPQRTPRCLYIYVYIHIIISTFSSILHCFNFKLNEN